MIRVPSQDKRLSQPNNSDLFGNLHYTKSVNLDEEGYIKLSSRAVSIKNSETDTDFNFPVSFGRSQNGTSDFFIATLDNPYLTSINNLNLSVTKDTDSDGDVPPNLVFDSTGKWWRNLWHVTTATQLFYKTPATGNWTNTGVTLTTGKVHSIEPFVGAETICVGNGNVVKQFTTAYAASTDLTLPTDYEVVGLSCSNNKMAVITQLSDTTAGQNQEAFFFVWDGTTVDFNQGFPIGSDMVIGIKPYKSSWVIITRTGQVKYFNGGGFEDLCTLPFNFAGKVWGDSVNRLGFGDLIEVEGDVIYFNINSLLNTYGVKTETYLYNNLGGILCYDPKVGLYHRYAPSISTASLLTVTSGNIDIATNILTKTAGTIPATGNPIKYVYNASTQIGGLEIFKIYYAIYLSSTTFALAETKALAVAGTKIDITSTGDTNNYFLALDVIDYGISKTGRSAGVALQDSVTGVYDHLIFGGAYLDSNSTTLYAHLNLTVDGFKNIGYFVTAKDISDGITDLTQKVYCKYRPLKTDDSIKIKYKQKDVLGIPVSTSTCTWTDANSFTTIANLSEVLTYLTNTDNECEVEIIAGAGAGQMSKISSITYLSGTYTVNLEDDVDGAILNNTCNVLIDNWKILGTITSADTDNYKEFAVAKTATWTKYKVIMTGSDITIEEFRSVSADFKKAV